MQDHESSELDAEIIDITPLEPAPIGRSRPLKWIILAIIILLIAAWQGVYVYTDSLWYGSLGFANRFWYVLGLGWILFAVFAALSFAILRGGFTMLERWFRTDRIAARRIIVNGQPVDINPAIYLRPLGWGVSIVFSLGFAIAMSGDWQQWTLFLNQGATGMADPIFQNPVGFYLFSLPVYQLIAGWLTSLTIILLIAAAVCALATAVPGPVKAGGRQSSFEGFGGRAFAAISFLLGALFLLLAGRTLLSRYAYLWADHASFSGVTYTEANYVLPGLMFVAAALVVGALIFFFNAFTKKGGRLMIVAAAFPILVYAISTVLIPAYVQSFIVKPNELGRETPYIGHNIAGTRTGFDIAAVEMLDYPADITPAAFNLESNRTTLANIRLWDWAALQDTLRQVQEIRTYYDFPDVDVDRYRINGEMRQVMLAAREFDINKLPEQSRNWINERLVYTHGYGLTMNTVNEFTSEGRPRFLLSNMPVEAGSDLRIARPEIYFGEKTDTFVYVNTSQPEFDYPQGENNNYTRYEGEGGFAVGGGLRRLAIALTTGDIGKLPFSDDVMAESRVLMHRNIGVRIRRVAPFLKYDSDPYIVINDDGRLVWMVDAYTTSDSFPYSRHYYVDGRPVNYIRNSVKVTIDAYTGAINYYVFDDDDPIVAAYRRSFPELFKPAADMPAGIRAHVRYPETLIKVQGDVFGLYHTDNAKMFFGREDVWAIASGAAAGEGRPQSLDPYQVLMPLPGEGAEPEFAQVLPFTPGNRNNMIAWMAGRSDGENYGELLVYRFPTSRVIDGPLQIEARIDQDAQIAGQITLWNQQGSKVKRGNLIIMPIGTGLLFVEPIYLQATRSPMPELRLVVLATQERLAFAPTFEDALRQLMGDTPPAPAREPGTPQPGASPQSGEQPPAKPATNDLIRQAGQVFADYQRLTSEGKLGEAGQKLDELKRILAQLQASEK